MDFFQNFFICSFRTSSINSVGTSMKVSFCNSCKGCQKFFQGFFEKLELPTDISTKFSTVKNLLGLLRKFLQGFLKSFLQSLMESLQKALKESDFKDCSINSSNGLCRKSSRVSFRKIEHVFHQEGLQR